MKLRPCIDIHNGAVKQIVGGSLKDAGDTATENFVSSKGGAYYSSLYKEKNLPGGHIILLNSASSPHYEATKQVALDALSAYPGGMQIGGGINPDNALGFLEAGASHVIVTSYVFKDGQLDEDALKKMVSKVGRKRLVLDLSVRIKDGRYTITTDRWQKYTNVELNEAVLTKLSESCDEFLVHAVDVEGKNSGIETNLLPILLQSPIPVTYAGGVHSYEDIDILRISGKEKIDMTIGSALNIFGGQLDLDQVIEKVDRGC